jgi:hypothetical protein
VVGARLSCHRREADGLRKIKASESVWEDPLEIMVVQITENSSAVDLCAMEYGLALKRILETELELQRIREEGKKKGKPFSRTDLAEKYEDVFGGREKNWVHNHLTIATRLPEKAIEIALDYRLSERSLRRVATALPSDELKIQAVQIIANPDTKVSPDDVVDRLLKGEQAPVQPDPVVTYTKKIIGVHRTISGLGKDPDALRSAYQNDEEARTAIQASYALLRDLVEGVGQ